MSKYIASSYVKFNLTLLANSMYPSRVSGLISKMLPPRIWPVFLVYFLSSHHISFKCAHVKNTWEKLWNLNHVYYILILLKSLVKIYFKKKLLSSN